MNNPTPVRHGNWHMVNGQLVDLDAAPAPATTPEAAHESRDDEPDPEAEQPAGRVHRRRTTSTKE